MREKNDLKENTVRGTIFGALERFSVMGIQIICTFIVARFLTPSDFGLVGLLIVFTVIGNTIVDSGFGQALVREKEVSDLEYSSVFYLNVFLSLIVYFLLFVSSGFIADFYKESSLKNIARVTFLVIPLNAFAVVQNAVLVRNLDFKKIFVVSLCASILSCVLAIILAVLYRNVWALVFQNIFLYGFRSIFLWILSKWHPIFSFSLVSIRKYIHFAINLLFVGFIGNIFNNIYSLIIGRVYSTMDLGYYSQADRIRMSLSGSSTEVIQRVTYPILSKINNANADVKEAYRKIIMITVFFVASLIFFFMGISLDLFEIVMGDKIWRVAGTFFFILCINGSLYPLHSINQNILLVKDRSKTLLLLEIARRFLMIVILCITVHFDIIIFVCGNAFYSISLLFLNLYFCGQPINYPLKEQFKDILPVYIRCVIMLFFMLIVNYFLRDNSIYMRVFTAACVGVFVFLFLFYKSCYLKLIYNLLSIYKVR